MAIDDRELDQRLKDQLRMIEMGETLEDLNDPEEYEDEGGIRSLRKAPSIKMASETGAEEFELELMGVINEYNDLKGKGDPAVRDISVDEYINMYLSKKKKSPNKMMAGMGNTMRLFETPYGFDRGAFEEMLIQYDDSGAKGRGESLYNFAEGFLGMVKKDTPSDRSMASMEENEKEFMRLVEEFMEQGFNQQQAIEAARDTLERKSVAMGGPMRMAYGNGTEEIVKPSKSMMMDTTTYPLGQDPQFDDKLINRPDPKDSKELKRLKELMERRKKEKVKRAMGGIAGVL